MIDLLKLKSCLEEIEEALTLPPSDEQTKRLIDAWEEGERILKGELNENNNTI
jgi:hypothetical protein